MKTRKTAQESTCKTPELKPICKNCKWWDDDHHCDFIDTITGEAAYKKGHGADIEVRILDDSGLCTYLKTGPDFGCVNFCPDGQS